MIRSHLFHLVCCLLFCSSLSIGQEKNQEKNSAFIDHDSLAFWQNHRKLSWDKKDYDAALLWSEKILHYLRAEGGGGNDTLFAALIDRAEVYTQLKKWKDAEADYVELVNSWVGQEQKDSVFGGQVFYLLGLNLYNQSRYKEALDAYQKALILRESKLDYYSKEIGNTIHNMGSCCLALGDLSQAETYYRQALDIRKKVYGDNHPEVAHPYQNLGNCYLARREYPDALPYLKAALKIRLEAYGNIHADVASNKNMLGICYYYMGETDLGVDYLEQALETRIALFGSNSPNNVTSYINLGAIHLQSFQSSKARYFLLKALDLQDKIDLTAKDRYWTLYSSIAVTYFRDGDFAKAGTYYEKAIAVAAELNLKPQVFTEVFENLGVVKNNLNLPGDALGFFKKAEALFIDQYGQRNKHLPLLYADMAKSYTMLGEQESAYTYLGLALDVRKEANGDNPGNSAYVLQKCGSVIWDLGDSTRARLLYEESLQILDSITPANWNGENQERFLNALARLAMIHNHLFELSGQVSEKEKALGYALRCLERLEILKNALKESDLIRLLEQYSHVESIYISLLTEGVNNENLSALSDSLFSVCERSRANALRLEFLKNTQLNRIGAESTEARRLKELKVEILALQKKVPQSDIQFEQDSLIQTSALRLRELESEYNTLADSILFMGALDKTRIDSSVVAARDIKHLLGKEQCVLTYKTYNKGLLVQVIDQNEIKTIKIASSDSLAYWIAALKISLQEYPKLSVKGGPEAVNALDTYIRTAIALHSLLVKPIAPFLKTHVYVIPDGSLVNLPFGALLEGYPARIGNYNSYPFLERKHSFSYGFSLGILKQLKEREAAAGSLKTLLAMAPFASDKINTELVSVESRNRYLGNELREKASFLRDSLSLLPYSGTEIAEIGSLFTSDFYTGSRATTDILVENVDKYAFIHLATHGKANESNRNMAYLAFAPEENDSGLLFARNIYHLNNKAELVVLSACETAGGQVVRGEGALSLTRAFVLSGSRAVISSLWPVDDRITSKLMYSFYRKVKEGLDFDNALHEAKMTLLNGKENAVKHPFYWAGYAGFGDLYSTYSF
jgi:CHAT domain-containing protein/Tfp pilus assembly protein PilF